MLEVAKPNSVVKENDKEVQLDKHATADVQQVPPSSEVDADEPAPEDLLDDAALEPQAPASGKVDEIKGDAVTVAQLKAHQDSQKEVLAPAPQLQTSASLVSRLAKKLLGLTCVATGVVVLLDTYARAQKL